MALTAEQKEKIKAAPDGQKFLLGKTTYVKQGDTLVKFTPSLASEVGGGLYQGAVETVEGIPAMLQAATNLPSAAYTEVQRVVASPGTEIPALAKGAAQTALGMVPESLRYANPLLHIASTKLGMPVQKPTPRSIARDVGSVGTSQLLGAAVPWLSRKALRIPTKLPGAAVALNEMAAEESLAIPPRLQKPGAVDRAFQRAEQLGGAAPKWHMGNLQRVANDIAAKELASANPRASVVQSVQNIIQHAREGWDYPTYKNEIERLGASLASTSGEEGLSRVHATEIKRLMRAAHRDIESGRVSYQVRPATAPMRVWQPPSGNAPGHWVDIPGSPPLFGGAAPTAQTQATAQAYATARKAARRAFAIDELTDKLTAAKSVVGDQYTSWNTNKALRAIDRLIEKAANPRAPGHKKAARFVGSWNPGELQAIRDRLMEIGRDLPKIPVGKGVQHGSGAYLVKAMIGELIGGIVGHPAAGTAVGVVGPPALARLVMTKPGREMVRAAAAIDPKIGSQFQNVLAGFMRTQAPENQPVLQQQGGQ